LGPPGTLLQAVASICGQTFLAENIITSPLCRMELRSKRSQSQPKPAAFQRRRIVDNSHRLRMLIIEPNTGRLVGEILSGHFQDSIVYLGKIV
jgi:hypothetical protein